MAYPQDGGIRNACSSRIAAARCLSTVLLFLHASPSPYPRAVGKLPLLARHVYRTFIMPPYYVGGVPYCRHALSGKGLGRISKPVFVSFNIQCYSMHERWLVAP